MVWTWRLQSADGAEVSAVSAPSHGNQSDAESWLGEQWRALAEQGVGAVSLYDGETKVYGPMPLAES